jgi:hypothetical protein
MLPPVIKRMPKLSPHMIVIKPKTLMRNQTIPPPYGMITKVSIADYEFV